MQTKCCVELRESGTTFEYFTHIFLQSECKAVKELPRSIGSLSNLVEISISKCVGLTNLPPELGDCENLEDLIMNKCKNITSLPDNMCN